MNIKFFRKLEEAPGVAVPAINQLDRGRIPDQEGYQKKREG
jgi:hypothetical protein